MKKSFVKPALETCEFVVAARLAASGLGGPHSAGVNGGSQCSLTASNGAKSCAAPSLSQSNVGNASCYY
jgi:hypothetical protein